MEKEKKTIFVGVSGGVDSSVSAALLKEQGHDVVGVFIRTWQPEWIECTWREEQRDAMRVCAHLDIPFVSLDLEEEYKKGVADYMIAEYRAGRTPNPDVMCNKEVKFGGFLKWALAHGADAVATGHYARAYPSPCSAKATQGAPLTGEQEHILLRGVDQNKDQSYFLWTLTQDQLKHIIFPIGHLPKAEVRKLAKKFKLPTATKKDSQGICFIGKISMKEFLSHYIDEQPGEVLDEKGKVIGRHHGALFFTIGERHGFEITEKGTEDKPYYVVAKDVERNTITVSPSPQSRSQSSRDSSPRAGEQIIRLMQTNWISKIPELEKTYTAQIRYHGEMKNITFEKLEDDTVDVRLEEYDVTIAAGQSVVIYDGNICVGGGVVDR